MSTVDYAAQNGHPGVVELPLGQGDVSVDIRDDDGRTTLFWAAGNRHSTVAKLLLERNYVDADSMGKYDRQRLVTPYERSSSE